MSTRKIYVVRWRFLLPNKGEIKKRLRGFLDPVVGLLDSIGVTPTAMTVIGLLLSFIGSIFVVRGSIRLAGLILLISGLCDALDGSIARRQNSTSIFGAFIDSTGDRISELLYFGAFILYFHSEGAWGSFMILLTLVALSGSLLTSYVRARAEGLGLECRVGWLERPERLVALIIGLLLGRILLTISLLFIAVMSVITVIQRIIHVRRLTAAQNTQEEGV
jgi:CDP-diacylglycerol--glycerol-3-phosphate 3-phosphatidyltransferase